MCRAIDRKVEDQPESEAQTDALSQEELIVVGAQAHHHLGEDEQHTSDAEERAEEAKVEESSSKDGRGEHEKVLKRADPRDLTGRLVRERRLLVVVLEDSIGVQIAKGDKGAPPAAKDTEPCLEAALGKEDLCVFALSFEHGLTQLLFCLE